MDADLIIVGGGCAGLSLAAQLAAPSVANQARPPLRTLILEPRHTYQNDRTWCGWRGAPHLFTGCISTSWSRWTVSCRGNSVTNGDGAQPYDCIPADRFYAAGLRAISDAPGITLLPGEAVTTLTTQADHVAVTTASGTLRARIVVDTRPPLPQANDGLLQSFAGLEVETETPCFDPAVVGLMAFLPGGGDRISFLYTLPFSRTRALLELTWMQAGPPERPQFGAVAALLRDRLGCGFTVLRRESGCLPMQPASRAAQAPGRILRMGIAGGALRPATGYGFATIQAQAKHLAATLAQGPDAARGWQAPRLPAWTRRMDRLFLRVLRRHPERAPQLFTTLFRRCPAAPLVRFLSGTGGLGDAARVALSLPPGPFLRELAW